jgi:hypothetical protein
LRNAVEQLHALLYSYPTAKAGFLVTGQPAEAGWPPELVSVVDLQDRLSSLRRTTNGARDAEFARLTPGTVDITVKLPFVSVAATVQLPVVSASAVVTATLAAAILGSAVLFLAVTGVLATGWQAIVSFVAATVFVTAGVALLVRFAPTSRLVWGVVGAVQGIGRDLAVPTIASVLGTVVGTLLTLVLTGTWP